VGQYVTWIQQNALYVTLPGEAFEERGALIQNGRAAMWTTRSDDRPFAIGVPEPFAVLPLPRLNNNLLPAPWLDVLFISSRVEDPTACAQWIEFLTTRVDVIGGVPARQSVADGRSWQNEVGPENAAVFREALARHLAASRSNSSPVSFGERYYLFYWLQEAAAAAAAGGDLNTLLAEAQAHSEQYLACLASITAPTFEDAETCAQQADADYNSDNQ
jgi:ABC-type glycerol-3-phosphate transport system substrate-binding protein